MNNDNFDESKRAFWDDLSAAADQRKKTGSSIGTAAMGKGSGSSSSRQGGGVQGSAGGSAKEEWDDW